LTLLDGSYSSVFPLGCLQAYPQNWVQSSASLYPGCYIESCNRMCRLRFRDDDGQVRLLLLLTIKHTTSTDAGMYFFKLQYSLSSHQSTFLLTS
jgi:hypothetical protein